MHVILIFIFKNVILSDPDAEGHEAERGVEEPAVALALAL
jgi:hypothetical protein